MSHTPGPWTVYPDGLGFIVNSEMVHVAKVFEDGGDSTESNAQLISAAPELLEALQEYLTDTCMYSGHFDSAEKARQAIAKATGG